MSLTTPELFSEVADSVTCNGYGDCVSLLREPDAANPHVRFDERGCGNGSMVGIVRHRQLKGSATDRSHLNHRATPRLHTSSETAMAKIPKTPKNTARMSRLLTPRSLMMMWLRFLSSSRLGSCKCFDKGVDITCVVVRCERDPNASATYTAHNIMTTKTFYNCLYVFARVSQ